MTTIHAVDLFSGAGGTSTGLALAAAERGLRLRLIAINHWEVAIETHSRNHSWATHYNSDLKDVDPRAVVPSGKLRLLVASPECTHFSTARGGKPVSKQSRASVKYVLRWIGSLEVQDVLIENVPEFMTWGPLHRTHSAGCSPELHGIPDKSGDIPQCHFGRPIKSREGEFFHRFIRKLRSLGYAVDYRVLNAANYGDPTSRRRLFIMARRGNRKIVWPEPTHGAPGEPMLFGQLPKWRTAREIIDWAQKGKSIFSRKKPLARNTLRRIFVGLRKFSGLVFVIGQQSSAAPRAVDQPVPTVAGAGAISLVEPFVLPDEGFYRGNAARPASAPLPAVTSRGAGHVVDPYIVAMYGSNDARSVHRPLPTVTGVNHVGLADPYLVTYHGQGKAHSTDEPTPTVTAADRLGLVDPFLLNVRGGNDRYTRGGPVDAPAPAVTTVSPLAIVDPCLVALNHGPGDDRAYPIDRPFCTVTSVDAWGVAEPVVNGDLQAVRVDWERLEAAFYDHAENGRGPLEIAPGVWFDVLFRMVALRELARAQGFADDYEFVGSHEEQVKQIGNAVPVGQARALCAALLG